MYRVSLVPDRVDLCVYAGDDGWLQLQVSDPDGAPVDLTGFTPAAQIRATVIDPDPPLATFEATVDGNVVHLRLPHEQSATLPTDAPLVWDAQVTDPDGRIVTLAFGRLHAVAQVTRP